MRPAHVLLLAVSSGMAVFCASRNARADLTSWLAVGGGGALERSKPMATNTFAGSLTYSVGVGTTPHAALVFGGIARGTTMFGLGTDAGLAVRAATGGFARGDWGAALDVGALWRPWAQGAYGEWPLQAVLTAGCPWGLQLAVGSEFWTLDNATPAQGFFAAVEIDLLRLTVMRQGATERWWPNPNPAGGRQTSELVP